MLTEVEKVVVKRAISQTWQAIAGDCFHAYVEGGEGDTMSREDVIEVVLDAGYIEMHGFYNLRPQKERSMDKIVFFEALKEFRKLDYEEQKKIAGEVIRTSQCM